MEGYGKKKLVGLEKAPGPDAPAMGGMGKVSDKLDRAPMGTSMGQKGKVSQKLEPAPNDK